MTDPYVGKLTFFRVYSGSLKAGSYVYNSTKDKKERIGRILQMHANHREDREAIYAGDIAAAVGLKDTDAPATRCATRQADRARVHRFPEPVIYVAIEPKTKADQESWRVALQKLAEEDPRSACAPTKRPARRSSAGMGELHLEIIVDRMMREFNVDANVGKPQVAYRETITKTVPKAKADSSARPAGAASTATCHQLEPNEPGKGSSSRTIVGGVDPTRIHPRRGQGRPGGLRPACWPAIRWWT